MNDAITVEAELVGAELEPVANNLFRTDDPVEIIRRASSTATALAGVLRERKLTTAISGKEHVRVEGWTLLGTMLGVFPVCVWTHKLEDGWEARVEARTLAGQVVGAAEAECLRSERMWANRDDYALRSMAQTRATSKALRQPLGFVISLAGFDPTPAEEMPREGFSEPPAAIQGPKPIAAPRSWAKLTELVAAYDQSTHDLFFAYADTARRYLYPESTDTKSLPKADKDALFRICAQVALEIRDNWEPDALPLPSTDDFRAAFAKALDGIELALPAEVEEQLNLELAERAKRDDA